MCVYACLVFRGQPSRVSSLFLPCGSWDWTWTIRLGSKCLYPLSHLAKPLVKLISRDSRDREIDLGRGRAGTKRPVQINKWRVNGILHYAEYSALLLTDSPPHLPYYTKMSEEESGLAYCLGLALGRKELNRWSRIAPGLSAAPCPVQSRIDVYTMV